MNRNRLRNRSSFIPPLDFTSGKKETVKAPKSEDTEKANHHDHSSDVTEASSQLEEEQTVNEDNRLLEESGINVADFSEEERKQLLDVLLMSKQEHLKEQERRYHGDAQPSESEDRSALRHSNDDMQQSVSDDRSEWKLNHDDTQQSESDDRSAWRRDHQNAEPTESDEKSALIEDDATQLYINTPQKKASNTSSVTSHKQKVDELLSINSEGQTEVENSGDESDDSVALLSLSGDEFVIPARAQRSSVKKRDDRAKNNIDTEDDDTAGRERALLSVPAVEQRQSENRNHDCEMVDENDTEVTLINTVKGRRDLHAKREDRNQPMESQIESPDLFSSPPQVLRILSRESVAMTTHDASDDETQAYYDVEETMDPNRVSDGEIEEKEVPRTSKRKSEEIDAPQPAKVARCRDTPDKRSVNHCLRGDDEECIHLINKVRKKRKLREHRPLYMVHGSNPVQCMRFILSYFENYRTILKKVQSQMLKRLPWEQPVVAARCTTNTLDYQEFVTNQNDEILDELPDIDKPKVSTSNRGNRPLRSCRLPFRNKQVVCNEEMSDDEDFVTLKRQPAEKDTEVHSEERYSPPTQVCVKKDQTAKREKELIEIEEIDDDIDDDVKSKKKGKSNENLDKDFIVPTDEDDDDDIDENYPKKQSKTKKKIVRKTQKNATSKKNDDKSRKTSAKPRKRPIDHNKVEVNVNDVLMVKQRQRQGKRIKLFSANETFSQLPQVSDNEDSFYSKGDRNLKKKTKEGNNTVEADPSMTWIDDGANFDLGFSQTISSATKDNNKTVITDELNNYEPENPLPFDSETVHIPPKTQDKQSSNDLQPRESSMEPVRESADDLSQQSEKNSRDFGIDAKVKKRLSLQLQRVHHPTTRGKCETETAHQSEAETATENTQQDLLRNLQGLSVSRNTKPSNKKTRKADDDTKGHVSVIIDSDSDNGDEENKIAGENQVKHARRTGFVKRPLAVTSSERVTRRNVIQPPPPQEMISCPMCQRYFAVRDIEDHAADCDGINIPEEPQTNAEAKYRQTQPGVEDEYRQTQPSMEGKFRQTQIKQPEEDQLLKDEVPVVSSISHPRTEPEAPEHCYICDARCETRDSYAAHMKACLAQALQRQQQHDHDQSQSPVSERSEGTQRATRSQSHVRHNSGDRYEFQENLVLNPAKRRFKCSEDLDNQGISPYHSDGSESEENSSSSSNGSPIPCTPPGDKTAKVFQRNREGATFSNHKESSPIKSFRPIKEMTDNLIDFNNQFRRKEPKAGSTSKRGVKRKRASKKKNKSVKKRKKKTNSKKASLK